MNWADIAATAFSVAVFALLIGGLGWLIAMFSYWDAFWPGFTWITARGLFLAALLSAVALCAVEVLDN